MTGATVREIGELGTRAHSIHLYSGPLATMLMFGQTRPGTPHVGAGPGRTECGRHGDGGYTPRDDRRALQASSHQGSTGNGSVWDAGDRYTLPHDLGRDLRRLWGSLEAEIQNGEQPHTKQPTSLIFSDHGTVPARSSSAEQGGSNSSNRPSQLSQFLRGTPTSA